jgi:C4-type Zn-finger protein
MSPIKPSAFKTSPRKASMTKASPIKSRPAKASPKKQVVIISPDDTAEDVSEELAEDEEDDSEDEDEYDEEEDNEEAEDEEVEDEGEEEVDEDEDEANGNEEDEVDGDSEGEGEVEEQEFEKEPQEGSEEEPEDTRKRPRANSAPRWSTQVQGSFNGTQKPTRRPHSNPERILKQRAAPVPIQKPDSWTAEQRKLDRQQQESFIKDKTAIEPGGKPEPPLFGMSSDLHLCGTDALPTIYSSCLTPTVYAQLREENQTLRCQVLDRIDACPICQETFEVYSRDRKTAHFKTHADQIGSAGKCPVCENDQWKIMDMDQRREHISYHYKGGELGRGGTMFEKLDCPVCDRELSIIGDADDILFHMAEHTPGVLRYCDRCGLNMKECSQLELMQHKKVCADAPDRLPGDRTRFFCGTCGKDRTVEEEKQLVNHRKFCVFGKGFHCLKCGYDMTNLDSVGRQRHQERCKEIGGYRKKFCRKCGRDVSEMSDVENAQYRDTCQLMEPPSATEDSRKKGEILIPVRLANTNIL